MPMTSDRKNLLGAETPAQGHTTEQGQVYVPPQDASHMRKSRRSGRNDLGEIQGPGPARCGMAIL